MSLSCHEIQLKKFLPPLELKSHLNLAFLGKPEVLIQNKLKEIFERQKQREKTLKWNPVFSHLLESKAALLQATSPQQFKQKTEQNNLHMLLTLLHPTKSQEPAPDPSSGQHPPSQAAVQPCQPTIVPPLQHAEPSSTEGREAPAKVPSEQTPINATQNGPQLEPSAPAVLPQALLASLPLIRSKTGRLILPSSLKPRKPKASCLFKYCFKACLTVLSLVFMFSVGQGFYTLMMMEPKLKEEQGEAGSSSNVLPPDGDSNKSLEKNIPTSDQPTYSENKTVVEDEAGTSDSDPRTPGGPTPPAEPDSNQPIVPPSQDFKDSDLAVIQPPSAVRLCFKPVDTFQEPDPSPPNGLRRRGRPAKKKGVGVKTKGNQIPQLTGKGLETGNTGVWDDAGEADWYPSTVKRGRGRPPKKGSANSSSKQSASDDDNTDSPIRFSIGSYKSPDSTQFEGDVYTSRPLTRGSLGKDFPSAKKRSWIDMERELEPDLDLDLE